MSISPVEIYLSSRYYTISLNSNKNDLSDLFFYFSQPIIRPDGYFMKLKVTSLTLPLSNYLVDSTNNSLIVNGTTYTVPQGNYNTSSLTTALNTLLSGVSTVSFSSTTNKFTFTSSPSITISSSSSMLSVLGLSSNTSVTGTSITSDLVCDLSGNSNIVYIDIPNVNTFNISSSSGRRTSIVKSIIVPVNQGAVLFYENMNDTHCYLQENMVNFLHIRLLGEDMSTLLKLNGVHWNMTLSITYVKMDDPVLPVTFKNYLLELKSTTNNNG